MTTWLDFRSEPFSNVPEVEIDSFDLSVDCDECGFVGDRIALTFEEAEEIKQEHQQWHEDGMPE